MKKNNWSLRNSMSSWFHTNETSITTLFAVLLWYYHSLLTLRPLERKILLLLVSWCRLWRAVVGPGLFVLWLISTAQNWVHADLQPMLAQAANSLTDIPRSQPSSWKHLMTTRDVIRVYFCTLLKSADSLCVPTRFFMSHSVKHRALE